MKRIIRASIGIGATIAIIFLVERTMDSFGFFDNVNPTDTTDSIQVDEAQLEIERLEKQRKKVNDPLKGDDVLDLGDNGKVVVKKIYKKNTFAPSSYMTQFEYPKDTIFDESSQRIDVTFELDEIESDKILFLALEGYDNSTDKMRVKYFKPRIGSNRLRLKTNFSIGSHKFRASYCYKEDAKKRPIRFYHEAFDVTVE
jgi:hypothetical protein